MVGINILKKMPTSLKPSIRAASIISCGNALAFCLNIIIKNGVAIVGKINHNVLFSNPDFENILNKGINTAANGTIIANKITDITVSFALSW